MDTPRPAAAAPWIAPGEPIISLRVVTKSFGAHTVLEDITFDVPKGRITAILGPSGTGKSAALAFGPLARPGEVAMAVRTPSDQPVPPD